MNYHPDECKESKNVDSSFPTKQVKATNNEVHAMNPINKIGSKDISPQMSQQQLNHHQIDIIAQPKENKPKSSRRQRPNCSNRNERRYEDEFEKYLIKRDEESIKRSKFDLNDSIMHKIVRTKEGLHGILSNNNTEKVMEKVPEVSHLSYVRRDFHENDRYDTDKHRHGHLYEQNPKTGKFLRSTCGLHQTNLHHSEKNNSQDEKIEMYHFLMRIVSSIADVVYIFVSGILAGFSIHTLHDVSSLSSIDMSTSFQSRGAGIIRFYLMSITLCCTGVIVQIDMSVGRSMMDLLGIPCVLIFLNLIALVLTLTIGKLELNLQLYNENSASAVLNQVELGRILNIIRCVICITQWFIVCCWNATSKHHN